MEGIVDKWKHGAYIADQKRTSWIKIKNPAYSQWEGRDELFERKSKQRHAEKREQCLTSPGCRYTPSDVFIHTAHNKCRYVNRRHNAYAVRTRSTALIRPANRPLVICLI